MERPITSISIVIPIYKSERYIQELLDRISHEKEKLILLGIDLLEVVCVCDEPIDNSISILYSLKNKYPFIKVIELSSNVGQHIATSAGIIASNSEWICTLDEDLQHSPELILNLLKIATRDSHDLIYAKSITKVHKWSNYRDISSKLAKQILYYLTGTNLIRTSSFRLIRSPIARTAAFSMDRFQYFETILHLITSHRRRKTIFLPMPDIRERGGSGYTLIKLFRHFSRYISSSNIGVKRTFIFLILPALFIIFLGLFMILTSYQENVFLTNPGWTSIFLMELILLISIVIAFLYSLKMYGILAIRSLSLPPFLVLDRSNDLYIYEKIKDQ